MLPSIRPLPVCGHQNRPYQFLVNKVFRMEAEEFSFKMQVLAVYGRTNSCRRRRSVQASKLFMANIYAFHCTVKLVVFK